LNVELDDTMVNADSCIMMRSLIGTPYGWYVRAAHPMEYAKLMSNALPPHASETDPRVTLTNVELNLVVCSAHAACK